MRFFYVYLFTLIFSTVLNAQSEDLMPSKNKTIQFVDRVKMSEDFLSFDFNKDFKSFTIEIAGPAQFYNSQKIKTNHTFSLESVGLDEHPFIDGLYTVQITANFELSVEEQEMLRYLTATNESEKLKAEKAFLNIVEVEKYSRTFSIKNGKFVLPRKESGGLKIPTSNDNPTSNLSSLRLASQPFKPTFTGLQSASTTNLTTEHLGLNPKPTFVSQVFVTDVIVQGSNCIGFDCNNGENFGFDILRLKENNLQIRFQDTSNSASFPSNDWLIQANDTTNGGENFFGIFDLDGNRRIVQIDAGAQANALRIHANNNIGIGTAIPNLEVHVVDGNSPGLRLEQDGSEGYTGQAWDIAGNETNFFIRDVTNASKLPFRIRPNAPNNSFYVDTDGDIGLGTESPSAGLHILTSAASDFASLRLEYANATGAEWELQAFDGGFQLLNIDNTTTALQVSNQDQLKLNQYIGTNFDNASPAFVLTIDNQGNVTKSPYNAPPAAPNLKDNGVTQQKILSNAQQTNASIANLEERLAIQQTQIKKQEAEIKALKAQLEEMNTLKKQVAELAKLMEK